MKVVLLFMVTIMLFFLWLVPIIWSFTSTYFGEAGSGSAYFGWYAMMITLTLSWGDVVKRKGCWFFD